MLRTAVIALLSCFATAACVASTEAREQKDDTSQFEATASALAEAEPDDSGREGTDEPPGPTDGASASRFVSEYLTLREQFIIDGIRGQELDSDILDEMADFQRASDGFSIDMAIVEECFAQFFESTADDDRYGPGFRSEHRVLPVYDAGKDLWLVEYDQIGHYPGSGPRTARNAMYVTPTGIVGRRETNQTGGCWQRGRETTAAASEILELFRTVEDDVFMQGNDMNQLMPGLADLDERWTAPAFVEIDLYFHIPPCLIEAPEILEEADRRSFVYDHTDVGLVAVQRHTSAEDAARFLANYLSAVSDCGSEPSVFNDGLLTATTEIISSSGTELRAVTSIVRIDDAAVLQHQELLIEVLDDLLFATSMNTDAEPTAVTSATLDELHRALVVTVMGRL